MLVPAHSNLHTSLRGVYEPRYCYHRAESRFGNIPQPAHATLRSGSTGLFVYTEMYLYALVHTSTPCRTLGLPYRSHLDVDYRQSHEKDLDSRLSYRHRKGYLDLTRGSAPMGCVRRVAPFFPHYTQLRTIASLKSPRRRRYRPSFTRSSRGRLLP